MNKARGSLEVHPLISEKAYGHTPGLAGNGRWRIGPTELAGFGPDWGGIGGRTDSRVAGKIGAESAAGLRSGLRAR